MLIKLTKEEAAGLWYEIDSQRTDTKGMLYDICRKLDGQLDEADPIWAENEDLASDGFYYQALTKIRRQTEGTPVADPSCLEFNFSREELDRILAL